MPRVGDQQLLRGVALTCLLESGSLLAIKRCRPIHEAVYIVSAESTSSAFLIKTSTAPKRWQFTFTGDELAALASESLDVPLGRRFFALVCKTDGVCCLSLAELVPLFDGITADGRSVGITRPRGGRYHISGPGRTSLGHTIPANDWPRRILREQQ